MQLVNGKVYKAKRDESGCSVTVNGKPLAFAVPNNANEDRNFLSQTKQFRWGDDSQASRYLAFCILHDFNPAYANVRRVRLAFHEDFIKQVRDDEWQLTSEELEKGIKFWADMKTMMPVVIPGEPMWRIAIPDFIWKVLIKRVKLPSATVELERVEEAMKDLGGIRGASVQAGSVVAEVAPAYTPELRVSR